MFIFKRKAMPKKLQSIEEPPYVKKGRGTPTTGKSPRVIKIFIEICQKKRAEIPIARKEP